MRGERKSAGRIAVAATLFASVSFANAAGDLAPERTTFVRATEKITLDGRLAETSWRNATPVTKFFETYPANLGSPLETTTATFLYDDQNIYVAIHALDHDPASIRAPLVRRDQVLEDQDYVEVFIDPLNTRRSAFFFRVSARGILTDGQYDDKDRIRDYAPDFDFDAATSIDDEGWTAEIRISLSSLRYRSGIENPWGYIVYRNLPRLQTTTIASAPIPRGERCDLCYTSAIDGIAVERGDSMVIVPHVTYERLDIEPATRNEFDAGIDLTWKPRANTVVDATVFPDFSQVEADAPQLTANTQFALSLTEKRPFFLEATDLLTTQIPAIYTRAFTDPDAGVRITDRTSQHEYTALALRDAGGGTVIEPGPTSSRLALQDFASTALVARNRLLLHDSAVGMLASARFNDDGSQNVVVGADSTWTPTASDQITAQFLSSKTRNPNRPDLLDTWSGQRLGGNAGALAWTHSSSNWYGNVAYRSCSPEFRAWNGFVTQVGIASFTGLGVRYFYPQTARLITRLGPQLTASRVDGSDGGRISQSIAPGFVLDAAGDTSVSLSWLPHSQTMTLAGPRTFSSYTLGIASTPFPWMPQATLSATAGDMVDVVTGAVDDGINVLGTLPLRFSRFEIASTVGYQALRGIDSTGARTTLLSERNVQMTATWHFSSRLNVRLVHQEATFEAKPPFAALEAQVQATSRLSSILLSYQINWQTRYYLGASRTAGRPAAEESQIFAKISYAFSR